MTADGGLIWLTTGERHAILEALELLPYGFAKDVAKKIENSKCEACHGCGLAPYVGGDDDLVCERCHGTGWPLYQRALVPCNECGSSWWIEPASAPSFVCLRCSPS